MPNCTNAHIGRLQAVALIKEAVASGTLWVGTKYRMQKEWGIMKPKVELVKDASGYWVIESDYDSQVVRETSETNLNWIISQTTIWILLKAALWLEASVAKSAPNATVYDHTFTVMQTNQHPSLSVLAYDPVWTYYTVYNMVKTLKITAKMWDYVKYDTTLIWKKITTTSTPTVWYTADNQFLARHVKLYTATTEVWLDSATAIDLNSFEFTIEKNIMMTGIWLEPDCILNQNFVVSWSLESIFTNNTDWLALTQWATEKFFRIEIINTDVTIWTSANPTLSFTFAKAVFSDWDKSDDNDAIITQTVWFVWHFDNTSWFGMKAKLTNVQSAVY